VPDFEDFFAVVVGSSLTIERGMPVA